LQKLKTQKTLEVNVWERGAGKTLACGTAACATGFIATELKLIRNPVNIHFEKGFLKILINENKTITMTGPVSDQKIIEVRV
jgi:diaminopimelate epimerase